MVRDKLGATAVEIISVEFDETSYAFIIDLDAELEGSPITFEEQDEEWIC